MKLTNTVNEVTLSNVTSVGEFKIRNSAKAFSILSSGLYSNKVKAIIRELSTNALDSHVAADKHGVPFEVHLPTMLEPWFSVRDFGLGLDDKQITNIYTTYFESSKTDSNDFVGALGLGSKSPFSYTENFTITSIKDGMKWVYSAFINDSGIPCVAEMNAESTTEGNGVEVKFSVTNKSDYNSFRYEALEVFKWFKLKPTVLGQSINFEEPNYKEKDIIPGIHVLNISSSYGINSIALMGNIAYPLNNLPEPMTHFGDLQMLLSCGLVIEFGIGELDFAASREDLSYIPLTINNIRSKLEKLNSNLLVHLSKKADAISSEWERAFFLYEESRTNLYKSVVQQYVIDTQFELYDTQSYYGRTTFKFEVGELLKDGIDVRVFKYTGGRIRKIGTHHEYDGSKYVDYVSIPVERNMAFVINDLNTKNGHISRARHRYTTPGYPAESTFICISIDKDDPKRDEKYSKFFSKIHNPPGVLKATELEKPPKAVRVSSSGICRWVPSSYQRGRSTGSKWEKINQEFDEDTTYYYVVLNNSEPEDLKGNSSNFLMVRNWMDNCGISKISKTVVYGVRKTKLKEIANSDNWIFYEDKLREEVAKISDSNIESLVARNIFDTYNNRVYTSKEIAKIIDVNSPYRQYVEKVNSIKRASGEETYLIELCKLYGKSIDVDKVKKTLGDLKTDIVKVYPLLTCIDDSVSKDNIIKYINMVDKQEKYNV